MKNTFIIMSCIVMQFVSQNIFSQNCSVAISGDSCTGTTFNAATTGGTLSQLIWYNYNWVVYTADQVSSPSSISVVAGNNGVGPAANQFKFPSGGISVDAAGNIYVADILNQRIQKWAPGATTGVTVAGGNGAGSAANQLYNPRDVFVDTSGNIYVADGANHRIQKWAPGATSGITIAGGNGAGSAANQLYGPRGIYVDNQGNMYIADTYNYRIQKWKAGAVKGTTVAGGNGPGPAANQLLFPIDVYLDNTKNIYIADAMLDDASNHRVQKWAPGATSGTTVAGGNGEGNASNQFGYLLGIYVDKKGTIYAADNGVSGINIGRIQKWAPGAINGVTVAGGHTSGSDMLSYPTGVALDKNGKLYVLDGIYSPKVQKYTLTNGVVSTAFSPSQPGRYTVHAAFTNGCSAVSDEKFIYAPPQTPIIEPTETGSRGNLCKGGIDTFLVSPWDDITAYTWKIPAKCSLIANKNDSVILSIPVDFKAGRLTVKATNTCGVSGLDTLALTALPLKPRPVTGLRRVFAYQQGLVYSIPPDNFVHNWMVPADAVIQAGQGTNSIVVNWGATPGIISVNSINDCGASLYKEVPIALKNSLVASSEVTDAVPSNINTKTAIIFPNPSRNNITVRFNSDKQMNYTIELQQINGTILMQKNIIGYKGINNVNLDISKYATGVYLINIKNAEKRFSLKLIKE